MGQHHPEKSDGLRGWGCLYHGKASHVGTLLKGLCAQGGEEMADSSTPQVSESLDWEKLLSDHRFREADAHRKKTFDKLLISPDFRTAHEKDFDRIVFSSPVRRLQDKTQVFPLDQHDSVRTRLTHSIEVANIGRTLATQLVSELGIKLPRVDAVRTVPALVAAISIAHDIGNPPFGHQGEAAIRGWVGTIAEKYDGAFSSEKDQALLAELSHRFIPGRAQSGHGHRPDVDVRHEVRSVHDSQLGLAVQVRAVRYAQVFHDCRSLLSSPL